MFLRNEQVFLEKWENYNKQSYRNRCRIMTSQGVISLSVPVQKKKTKLRISEVNIDYGQKWVNQHLRTIRSAYGKAPFFEFYWTEIHRILSTGTTNLFDLNTKILTQCLTWLDYSDSICCTEGYFPSTKQPAWDLRDVIHPKKHYLTQISFCPQSYTQVFGNNFVEELSILDLLFCEGPGARQVILNGIMV